MIATYIQELLATENRVIVPNYGAFLVRATSKNKDAKTLEEKLKDIYFSPFLKFNDELLEKYIIKKEKITKEEAAEKIAGFISEVKKELEQEQPYIIEGFGQFVADRQGKVQFITIKSEETSTPKKTTSTKATSVKTTSKTEKSKQTEKLEQSTPKATVKKEPEPKEDPTKETEILLQEEKPEIKTPPIKPEVKKAPIKTEPPKQKIEKKEKKPVNKGLIWSIAIGVPIAAVFIWGVLNFDTVKKVIDKHRSKTEKPIEATILNDTARVEDPDSAMLDASTAQVQAAAEEKEMTQAQTMQQPINQKKYYIIAGSFKNEKYANAYVSKLQAEGYNAEKLRERNGMYAVSYNSYVDKRKAIAEYKFLSEEKGLQTWILYF